MCACLQVWIYKHKKSGYNQEQWVLNHFLPMIHWESLTIKAKFTLNMAILPR
jgi:hypothetical protein